MDGTTSEAEMPGAGGTESAGADLMGLLALFLGAFLIFNTFRTIVLERRHDLSMLRAIGATRAQLTQMILIESVLQGLVGTLLGLLLGYLMALGLANTMNNIPARVVLANGIIDWRLIVPEDSPIKEVKELKGKAIGVPSLGTGGMPLLKAYLRDNGINPDTEVKLIPLGIGAPRRGL